MERTGWAGDKTCCMNILHSLWTEYLRPINRAIVQHQPDPLRHIMAGRYHLSGSRKRCLFEGDYLQCSIRSTGMAGNMIIIKVQRFMPGPGPGHSEWSDYPFIGKVLPALSICLCRYFSGYEIPGI